MCMSIVRSKNIGTIAYDIHIEAFGTIFNTIFTEDYIIVNRGTMADTKTYLVVYVFTIFFTDKFWSPVYYVPP